MNANDVLKYGHLTVMKTIDGFPEDQWETEGVCGHWSARDVIAHLASYEQMLMEMVGLLNGDEPGPILRDLMEKGDQFNDHQVARYQDKGGLEVLADYVEACQQARAMVAEIPADRLRQVGTLPTYGEEYAFDDMLVYQYYGHKREHSAQIAVFLDGLAG